jgi:hypothetical protein
MNFADVERLAKASGFIVAMNEGDLLTLPAGHIIVNYVKEDSVYIKWSTYAKSDRSQVESDKASWPHTSFWPALTTRNCTTSSKRMSKKFEWPNGLRLGLSGPIGSQDCFAF